MIKKKVLQPDFTHCSSEWAPVFQGMLNLREAIIKPETYLLV